MREAAGHFAEVRGRHEDEEEARFIARDAINGPVVQATNCQALELVQTFLSSHGGHVRKSRAVAACPWKRQALPKLMRPKPTIRKH